MNQAGELEPIGVTVPADRLCGLQVVFDLGKVGVGIAVVHECVEVLERLPDSHAALVESAVFALFREHEVARLILMVQPVEFADAGRRRLVIPAEGFFLFAGFIAALYVIVPSFEGG
jgi:hypothetical protein